MKEILPTIYCWFESLFGSNLADYLWGYNCDEQAYTGDIIFNLIGFLAIIISLFLVLAYYYWPLNHPRFNRWWSWLIVLILSSILNLFVGYTISVTHLNSGDIGSCMTVSEFDCWMFGVANFIVSAFFFSFLTLIFKWKSSNAKYSPF